MPRGERGLLDRVGCRRGGGDPTGSVGSIGVFGVHDDVSGAREQQGVKRTIISAGRFKADGWPSSRRRGARRRQGRGGCGLRHVRAGGGAQPQRQPGGRCGTASARATWSMPSRPGRGHGGPHRHPGRDPAALRRQPVTAGADGAPRAGAPARRRAGRCGPSITTDLTLAPREPSPPPATGLDGVSPFVGRPSR